MKHNVRSKISDFLKSEDGRIGAKSPLALGVASASLLLAHAIVTPSAQAHFECYKHDDCSAGEFCLFWCKKWSLGTCQDWHSHCKSLDS